MNEELKNALDRYEALKIQAGEIENELKMLAPVILENTKSDDKIVTEKGSFTIQYRSVWKFSPYVIKMEEDINELKAEEKADGSATEVRGAPFLVYKSSAKSRATHSE